ncbi:transcription factor grauzone-like [Lucilia sericata]|uniref:transcription factor grauzone-like n=1 Tax=Lucilia sericata TaxID=13632 RepID=UPI0018A7ECA9|nr:transcription factor grauzone-like [Lucilia sericata]
MDSCLLCLEFNKDFLDFIQVNTMRWQELEITKILEKHFWSLRTIQTGTWLCLTCWKELDSFHKFYLRIEEAHINFGKVNLDKEFKEENVMENLAASCLEPEILIEPNAQEILEDEETTCIKSNNKLDSGKNLLNNDPLEKVVVIKTKNKRNLINKTKTEIKSELHHSSDSASDREEDNNSQESSKEAKQKMERLNRKETDKFIAENFEQMFCDLCGVPFENFSSMQKHFSRKHERKGYLLCCNRKFYERNNLVDHLQCHLNPDYFKCTQCGKILSDRKNFKSHQLRVHRPNDVVLKHSCDICGKSFTQGYVLRTHKLTHLPKEEKKFPCTECGKFYGNSYLLKIHTEVVHLKKQAKVCYICGKTLGTSTEYKTHMNKHEGIPTPVINCDVCGLRLISERSLKLHKESQHPVGGKQDHPCPICHKISPTARALKKHINTMHERGCDHKCTMCGKAFRRPETLKEHIASQHTGATLYTCPWCPKTFNSNGNMHAHRKNVHPKECLELKLQRYSRNIPPEIS